MITFVKPFKPKELISAPAGSCSRRVDAGSVAALAIGDLEIDVKGHKVARAGSSFH